MTHVDHPTATRYPGSSVVQSSVVSPRCEVILHIQLTTRCVDFSDLSIGLECIVSLWGHHHDGNIFVAGDELLIKLEYVEKHWVDFYKELTATVGAEALQTLDPLTVDASQLENLKPAPGTSTTVPAKYTCSTQKPIPTPFQESAHTAALQVGLGKIIPRWKTGPDKSVNFAAFANGYPKPELALLAAQALKQAADEWNTLELGVQLKWVAKIEDAAFVLSFAGDQDGVLAEAFFLNEADLNVLNVYNAAFQPGTVQYLKNIFLHELGHVLGLRHEFAPELEDTGDNYTVQIGPRNPLSVMGYEFPPQIQPSDVENVKAFYKFPGTSLGWKEAHTETPPKSLLLIKDCDANN